MKKKGISLIVLIITIVVIIILAASIILNLSKTNIIGNANTAVLKSDIATLQSELDLYVSDRFVDEKGKYDRKKLNADQATAMYGTENVEDKNSDGSVNIYDILTSLEKSKNKNNIYIQEGKLVFKNSGLKDEEVEVILGLGYEVDGMPKVTSISTNSTLTSIEVTLNVTLAEEVEKYVYILNGEEREESTEITKTYTGLTPGVNYTLEVILVLKDGTEISKKEIISTKNIDGEITYTLSETEWTKNDVTVTLEYSEETLPEGYVLQYRTKDIDGNTIQDWTAYTAPVVVTENNTSVVARLYNETLQDEKIPSDTKVQNIDKDVPTIPTLTLTATKDTVTAVASGSEDVGSGIDKYMYSMDNTTWQDSNEFTGLNSSTEYTIYAKAIDNVGNESEVVSETITTKTTYYVIVEVLGHYSGNSANINELEFYDKDGSKIEYTILEDEAYDSVTNSKPHYWLKLGESWAYDNLYDGEVEYSKTNSTIFLNKYGVNTYGSNSKAWTRFLVDVGENINIADVMVCIGDSANRTPKSVSIYEVNEYSDSTYTNNIKQRNNDGLTLVSTLEFDSALAEPTWFSFMK